MSATFSVYVGPFIEVTGLSHDLVYEHSEIVSDGRGELGVDEMTRYVIPNKELPNVTLRQVSFDRYREVPAFGINASRHSDEMMAFRVLAKPFTDAIVASGGRWRMKWGVVCGMS